MIASASDRSCSFRYRLNSTSPSVGSPYLLRARWQLIKALEKAGQAEKAKQLRAEAASSYRRDASYVAERKLRFGSDS